MQGEWWIMNFSPAWWGAFVHPPFCLFMPHSSLLGLDKQEIGALLKNRQYYYEDENCKENLPRFNFSIPCNILGWIKNQKTAAHFLCNVLMISKKPGQQWLTSVWDLVLFITKCSCKIIYQSPLFKALKGTVSQDRSVSYWYDMKI